jgi:hypothetical protein
VEGIEDRGLSRWQRHIIWHSCLFHREVTVSRNES